MRAGSVRPIRTFRRENAVGYVTASGEIFLAHNCDTFNEISWMDPSVEKRLPHIRKRCFERQHRYLKAIIVLLKVIRCGYVVRKLRLIVVPVHSGRTFLNFLYLSMPCREETKQMNVRSVLNDKQLLVKLSKEYEILKKSGESLGLWAS